MSNSSFSQRLIFFVAPGILEVPTRRGGGIEQNIFHLAEHIIAPTIIFSPHPRQATSPETVNKAQIKYSIIPAVAVYPSSPHFSYMSIIHYIQQILFALDASTNILALNRKIEAVVVFDKFSGLLPIMTALLTRKKRVYMEYNIWPWVYYGNYRHSIYKLQMIFGRIALNLSSHITANSPSIKIGMVSSGIPPSKIDIIPTGIGFREVEGKKKRKTYSDRLTIIYVGRLVEERGADLLIPTISLVSKKRKNLIFRIIGGGPLFIAIRDFVKENNLESTVDLLGQNERGKVLEFIGEADVALFISKNENYGSLALLECMAIGCPVIATDVGSTSEMISDKFNGILVSPSPDSIARAIIWLDDDKISLRKMSENCRRVAAEYDWKKVSCKFLRTLRKTCS